MSSSDLHRSSLNWRYHMHAPLLFWLFPLINTLQNHVWSVWPFNRNHLKFEVVSYHHSWVRIFTNFTLKFVKVVCFYHSNNFLFNFTINPLFQTFGMNECTWTFTFAWRNNEILLFVIITKTYFAGTLDFLCRLENSVEFAQEDVFQNFFVFGFW